MTVSAALEPSAHDLNALGDARRIVGYAWLAVAAYALAFIALVFVSRDWVDPSGKPIGYDFITFWSAGILSLEGKAAAAFDPHSIFAMQRVAVPASGMIFLWHYPPTFQLVAAALALMPYLVSYAVFAAASLALYVAVLRRLVPWREGSLLLVAFPATFICLLHGQNSLVSAALLAGAILWIDRRPVLAGVCIGLLAYKPQLAVLVPVALALTGRWRVFMSAAATLVVFAGAATVAFGLDLWGTFLANTSLVARVMEGGNLPWAKMPSAFIFLRMLGVGQTAAYAVQVLVALSAAAITFFIWWRNGPTRLAGATLVAGTLLLSPYTFDYELAILAVPLLILARDVVERGGTTLERATLLALYVTPGGVAGIASATGLQVGFLALVASLAFCVRRALSEPAAVRRGPLDWLPGRMFSALN